jgi:CheY-like chemotaxis protein
VRTIRTSGDALLSVINDVLDFSKIESGRLELETYPLAVRDCIGDVLALVAHRANEKGLTLTGNVDPAVPSFVLGDPSRLRQVLLNLVSNAVKFTERGEVCVSADVYAGESLSLHFAVSDSGIGIASERMHQLFDSFSQLDASMTRRYGGSGLGLAISRRLTELMGGSLWVESTLGQGSTFHFTIATAPLSVDPGNTEQRGTMPLISDLGASFPCQILLVEDNIVNQKVAQHLLGRMGYHADVAANGVEAIAALQSQRYDVLLMDLHMPEMDGLEATRIIRRQLPPDSQPVIVAMTAAALLEDQKASVEAGMDAFITKPVRLEQLVDVLRSVCRNRTYVKRQDTKVDDLQL